jgi:threonine dehydrogenase-like Zn-dependent dehydrogenase
MCTNGRYTEHGIKGRDGFIRERYRVDPDRVIVADPELGDLAVLVEPVSVVAKAWDHIERIASRATWKPKRALITGAGPIGLFAAMIGSQKGIEVHVVDRVTEGPKPALVEDQGWCYHSDLEQTEEGGFDAVIECTGVGPLVFHAIEHTAPAGVMALTGIASGDRVPIDAFALNKEMVLNNTVVFGSVNAGRRHYEQAAEALAKADPKWLERLITRRVPLDRWQEALERRPDDVKTVIAFGDAS